MTSKAAGAQIDARVVDQALIASFMNAEPPKVWRADMAKLTTATLELRSEEGRFRLVMISASGEEEVASFNSRDEGTAALQAVMQAMVAPVGAAAVAAAPVPPKSGFFAKLLKFFLWLVAIVVTLVIVSGLLFSKRMMQVVSVVDNAPSAVVREGAPTSADDFFGGR